MAPSQQTTTLKDWLRPKPGASTDSAPASPGKRSKPLEEADDVGLASKKPRLEAPCAHTAPFALELDARRKFSIPAPPFSVRDTFSAPDHKGKEIRKGTLDLVYFKSFLVAPARQQLFRYLLDSLPWYRVVYQIRGMTINTPRYTTVFGIDDASPKPLSQYHRRPREIPPVLRALKEEVEARLGEHFNFVLVNYYADGKDSISYHSDSEDFLGPNPTIASLTLGAPRDFLMRPKPPPKSSASASDTPAKKAQPEKWVLESGDMIVMRGTTQATWEHSIPKRSNAKGRINITLRKAISAKGTDNYYRYNVGDGPVYRFVDGGMTKANPQP